MPSTARLSVAMTAQVQADGVFPSFTTYPASFERYLTNGTSSQQVSKVFATTGVVGSVALTLAVAGTLSTVKVWYVENTSETAGNVTLANAPVNATVSAGQCLLATNDVTGWAAANVTVTGTAGASFKIIALGN